MDDEQGPPEWFLEQRAALEGRLKVGQRVRVRLSECDSHWHAGHDNNGRIGVIDDVEPAADEARHTEPNHVGHRFLVIFDPTWRNVRGYIGSFFAAEELEPLDAQIVNVADFGATGDGSDQTEAIQAAVNALRTPPA